MDRMNGEIRDREKTMSFKKVDTPILKGLSIYHNYIRGHQGIRENKTQAEKAGIEIEGENKWLTIIQNASKDEKR
jgi:putative transposase